MGLIYPEPGTKIYFPMDLGGNTEKTLFVATHRTPRAKIYWHLDNEYPGFTADIHEMEISANSGFHTLTLVDEIGQILNRRFEILEK